MSAKPSIVVFDVGNVLIDWDVRRVYRNFFPDETTMEAFFQETSLMAWNVEQDRGREWGEAEQLLIAEFPHYKTEILAFRPGWHDMVSGPVAGAVEVQQALLNAGVPLYAITNFAADTFKEAQQRFPFMCDFIDIVVSAEEKLLKPDAAIYQCLLARNNLNAADCLFIDDSLKNIDGAKAIGMMTHHFTGAEALKADLHTYGLLA